MTDPFRVSATQPNGSGLYPGDGLAPPPNGLGLAIQQAQQVASRIGRLVNGVIGSPKQLPPPATTQANQTLTAADRDSILSQLVIRAGTDPSILQVGRVVPIVFRGKPSRITMTQFLIDQVVRQLPVKQLPGMANRDP
ncbi:MAG: hypothetical protein JO152_07120 [Mycobacteriaceae bacterium]|nr:hypothetical protein [Mycobacteriaceae bacterium]